MVKSYLKYEHSKTFGLITAASANVVWSPNENALNTGSRSTGAGRAVVGADEEVLCWDVKKGELLDRWKDKDCRAEVTVVSRSKVDPDIYAVGYGDGSIRIWDSRTATVIISFNGHRSAITTLAFDKPGVRLASGARDTDIIVWDLVAEVGLYKLRGHKDQVTALHFLTPSGSQEDDARNSQDNGNGATTNGRSQISEDHAGFLLTTSKDALIKIWDLESQHCIETHVAQTNGECWTLGVSPDESGCITAGNDGELKVWSIECKGLSNIAGLLTEGSEKPCLRERGILYRQGKDRTLGIKFHARGNYIAAHGSEKAVELWRVRSESEVQKSLARKRKRRREKALAAAAANGIANGGDIPGDNDNSEDFSSADISEVIVPYVIVRTSGKVRSFDWASDRTSKALQLLIAMTNNLLEVYSVPTKKEGKTSKSEEPPDYNRTFSVEMPGHRTDVRGLCLSSDDRMLASASNGSLKIWNVRTQSCIRTLECGYALCAAFLPGDKIVVVGNRNGELELFDIASSTLIETVKAHDGPVWTLNVHPDGKSMASGSADKSAKFWTFEIVQEEIPGTKRTTPRLKLVHTRTLKVADDILSLRFSPDSRLLAVALLDNTVKVFFVDSLKLFLNLYGHKLPVLNMDISCDSKLIVTCSADKNVRLWGLDFGDCHKAFFAHQDSIMQVAFVPHNQDGNGHHFFSASKDRMIKYWDGDKFEQIQKLEGHHGEIWALAVSRTGEFVVSASHDKSIRVWQQTDEQIFLEEEREKELEELYESTLTTSLEQEEGNREEKSEVAAAGKQTVETLMAGERIAEALEIGIADLEMMREWHVAKARQPNLALPARNPIFMAFGNISAEAHVLSVVQKIKAAALQDALLVLPFEKIPSLFTFLRVWAERQWNMPLACRILSFMLKTHHRQIVASKTMRPMLDGIREHLRRALQGQKDEIGFNLAALKFMGKQLRENETSDYVDEEVWDEEEKSGGGGKSTKKRAFVDVA
ncbi:MAG: WD domain [Lasallia pustulata]|uniref:WD domain n=1 Tax=Lasallia pustulata TaxID=136370 RepID=A0A5M8Q502_9LECA|nr:MAG: WD domain [Lasallia pustulata]